MNKKTKKTREEMNEYPHIIEGWANVNKKNKSERKEREGMIRTYK